MCICCNYAVHALHQRYISYSTPHFTPQNSLLKTSNSSRPGLTQGQGARGTDIPGDAAGGNKKLEEREDLLRLEGVRAGRELGQLLLQL